MQPNFQDLDISPNDDLNTLKNLPTQELILKIIIDDILSKSELTKLRNNFVTLKYCKGGVCETRRTY